MHLCIDQPHPRQNVQKSDWLVGLSRCMIHAATVGYRSSLHTVYGYKLDSYNNYYYYVNNNIIIIIPMQNLPMSLFLLSTAYYISLGSKISLHMAHLQHISFAGINVIPQYIHCLYLGRFYVRLKSICMSSVLLQYYQPTYLYIVYRIAGNFRGRKLSRILRFFSHQRKLST